jgi:hypothetical protein
MKSKQIAKTGIFLNVLLVIVVLILYYYGKIDISPQGILIAVGVPVISTISSLLQLLVGDPIVDIELKQELINPIYCDWFIYIKSYSERRIKCIVLLDGIILPWVPPQSDTIKNYMIIEANSANNILIPKKFTKDILLNAKLEIKDNNDTLKKIKFKDIVGIEKLL